ncbi:MAG: LysE family translocator [Pikeienuella sp.]
MIAFTAAVFFLLITPGPGVLTTAGVGAGFGAKAGLRFLTGLFIGTNLVAVAVITGMAAIIFDYPIIRTVLAVVSFGYLAYLAFRIATAGAEIRFISHQSPPGLLGGVALQAINPKAYAVNSALFTGFAIWPSAPSTELLFKFVVINSIWIPVHLLWLWAGVSLERLELSRIARRRINLLMSGSLMTVVILAMFTI